MKLTTQELGGLTCRVVDALPDGEPPKLAAVICHGFGAPGTDLVGLGGEILSMQPQLADALRFYFPEAPLSLAQLGMPGGRAWWMLDIDKLNAAIETGEFRDLRNDHPPQLPAAREKLTALIESVRDETGLPMSRIALGGFSQGAMLTTDVALRLPDPPALLAVFSGTLLSEEEWRDLASNRGALDVLQSHGRQDPILPYQAAEWLRDLLRDAGADVEFLPFDGPHAIPPQALDRFATRLSELRDSLD